MQQERDHHFKFIYDHHFWNSQIKPSLKLLADKKLSSGQIIAHLLKFSYYSHTLMQNNPRFQKYTPTFSMVHKLYPQSIVDIFADASSLILQYEYNPPQIPVFYSQVPFEHNFKKSQVLLLMCMMAFSLIMTQDFRNMKGKFCNYYNFSYILSCHQYKTITVMEYLKTQLAKRKYEKNMMKKQEEQDKEQLLTIRRVVQTVNLDAIINQKIPMGPMIICHDNDSIQNHYGCIKADFANKFIGGGSLTAGCVQQEIMFANHPELYISMLFCEKMRENQSIFFIGFKKYFKNKGYAATASYDGYEECPYEYDQERRAKEYITAIDAIHFPTKVDVSQFSQGFIDRQLYKAYIGFKSKESHQIVTGNWGCGAFNGDITLKFMIQWIACSLSGKQLIYTPFGFQDKLKKHEKILKKVQKMNTLEVYLMLIEEAPKIPQSKIGLFELLAKTVK